MEGEKRVINHSTQDVNFKREMVYPLIAHRLITLPLNEKAVSQCYYSTDVQEDNTTAVLHSI